MTRRTEGVPAPVVEVPYSRPGADRGDGAWSTAAPALDPRRTAGPQPSYGPPSSWSGSSTHSSADLFDWDSTTEHVTTGTAPQRRRRAASTRGLPGWAALFVLLVIAGIGGLIDTLGGSTIKGGFNIGLIVASLVAILLVRHRDMFTIVVAPPLVYFFASAAMLYIRSHGLHNHKILIDAAANWLVYGFPAIAGATAAVLIVAGIRLIVRR